MGMVFQLEQRISSSQQSKREEILIVYGAMEMNDHRYCRYHGKLNR